MIHHSLLKNNIPHLYLPLETREKFLQAKAVLIDHCKNTWAALKPALHYWRILPSLVGTHTTQMHTPTRPLELQIDKELRTPKSYYYQ